MKSKEEFDRYYESELKSRIGQLESKRLEITGKYSFKSYKRNLKWLAILCIVTAVAQAVSPANIPEFANLFIPISIGYAVVAALYIYIMRMIRFNPVKKEYKETVIPKIIAFVDTNLIYKPDEGITKPEFDSGGLFGNYTKFRSEDLVYGKSGEVEIKMSDIEATRSSSSSSKSGSSTITVFKGIYIISKLTGKMPSGVIITPSLVISDAIKGLAAKFLGNQLVETISKRLNMNDIQTGHEEFDKAYLVKSVNPEVAKELLTPTFIQLIMTFQKELNLPVSFSFFDQHVHIAFSGADLFESDVHTSFVEKDISRQYFSYINLAFGIVEAIQAAR